MNNHVVPSITSGQNKPALASCCSRNWLLLLLQPLNILSNMGPASNPLVVVENDLSYQVKHQSLRELTSFRSDMSNSNGTYSNQSQLPRLPIPTLEETLHKFPKVLEALQDKRQLAETRRVVEEFLNGEGPALQQALMEYEKAGIESGEIGSYVEEFWNESYLSPDASVVLNLNPFFVLEDAPDSKMANDQLSRAASLCFASIKLASLLKNQTLPPDSFKNKPLCMDQFKALFGSSRQPMKHEDRTKCDEIHVYSNSSHVVVLCKNQFFYFPALWPEIGDVAVDETDILDILKAIHKYAHQMDDKDASKQAIGIFSSLPRSEWAKLRDEIGRQPSNQAALHIIDSALFVLVLDDFTPQTASEAAAAMLHGTNQLAEGDTYQVGTCMNRWYDKLQLIVAKDGTAGCNFEHSAVDGHTALRFVSDVFAETVISFAESIVDVIHGRGRIQHVVEAKVTRAAAAIQDGNRELLDVFPKKIIFDLPDKIVDQIFFAETEFCDNVTGSDTCVLEFRDYGKKLIVANNLSPDSVVQMVIILAYYQLYGKLVCTYEPCMTKTFYHGRTEAMRSATSQAKDLCEIWVNPLSTTERKLNALRVATIEHSRLVQESSCGRGVDRHLFALKCIAEKKNMPVPKFFQSEAWKTLNHTILSTSNCGNPALRLFGFGPVVPNGFGIGYIIKDGGLSFSVSSKHRQTQRYVRSLNNTLKDLRLLLKSKTAVEVQHRPTLMEAKKSISSYDDMFGESSIPEKRIPLQTVDEHEESHKRKSLRSSRRSQYFTQVKERSLSFDFMQDPSIQIDLEFDG